jgi:hypothetical protein
MADELLLALTSPGPVDLGEFTDWYDNEHVPARLATPGFGAVARFHALDGATPEWLATYEVKPGTLESPAYLALAPNASEREKRILSAGTLDRRVYSLLGDYWAEGRSAASGSANERRGAVPPGLTSDDRGTREEGGGKAAHSGAPERAGNTARAGNAAPVVMLVSMSVPPEVEPDLTAYYEQEHFPLLLNVPGWRRARRYVLTSGTGPKYLSLHEVDSQAAFDQPGYAQATSTPWRNRIVGAAIGREKRIFGLHKSFS